MMINSKVFVEGDGSANLRQEILREDIKTFLTMKISRDATAIPALRLPVASRSLAVGFFDRQKKGYKRIEIKE